MLLPITANVAQLPHSHKINDKRPIKEVLLQQQTASRRGVSSLKQQLSCLTAKKVMSQ